jgi:hypothetical protein
VVTLVVSIGIELIDAAHRVHARVEDAIRTVSL